MKVIGFRDREVDSLVFDCRDILKGEELSFSPDEACKYIMSDYIFVLPISLFIKDGQEVNRSIGLKSKEEMLEMVK